jgi:hypothetical protein
LVFVITFAFDFARAFGFAIDIIFDLTFGFAADLAFGLTLEFAIELIFDLTFGFTVDLVFDFNFGFTFDFFAMTHILSLIKETLRSSYLKIGLRHAQTNRIYADIYPADSLSFIAC